MRERLAVLGREPRADTRSADIGGARIDVSRALDVATTPQLFEREPVRVRDLGRVDRDDDVLLPRPRVVRPVRRAAPDGLAVADDELVVHEVWDPGDASRLDRERLDRARSRLGRRWHGDRTGVVDVVEQADLHAALHSREE